ncbi:hypothetical protein FGADI_12627 [Fusarium gaditjirri]|uniref:Ankyrin repeat protein n=1 Tax=Fusarium gaditjirri TaxID=282569 RepID=A0A8H4SRR7_9HYPO|nr:hypothetical protein FGADI_12627 [Fusarium gaditjirri]
MAAFRRLFFEQSPSDHGDSFLFHIVAIGDDHELETMLSTVPELLHLEIRGDRNVTLLMAACIAGHAKVVDPLLSLFRLRFAVAADNVVAVQTLLEYGAYPFDVHGQKTKPGNQIGSMAVHTPVDHAAIHHQHRILKLLLSSRPQAVVAEQLTTRVLHVGPRKHAMWPMSPLQWTVDFQSHGLRQRVVLHGNQYQAAPTKTLALLVEHGANPGNANGTGTRIIELTIPRDQPFMIVFLAGWEEVRLLQGATTWLRCLKRIVEWEDRINFDALMEFPQADDIHDASVWFDYFDRVCQHADQP